MSSSKQCRPATRMFARVIGPFLIIIPATAIVRADDMRTLLSDFGANPLWSWVAGSFILLAGLVTVALHQYWRGAAEIMVSVVGWVVVAKGLFLVAFPRTYLSAADAAVGAVAWWRAAFIAFALLGLYLTYVGWVAAPRRPVPQPASSTPDIARAA
jgi:hypothetical protein